MKLYIKQKVFSWRDRFSVCDGRSEPCYTVEGEIFTWGRKLHIRDMAERELAFIQQKLMSWLPRYQIFIDGTMAAEVVRELSFFRPRYAIPGPGWSVTGDFWEHDYDVVHGTVPVFTVRKEWLTWGDCYTLDIFDPKNELLSLSVALAIDAVTSRETAPA